MVSLGRIARRWGAYTTFSVAVALLAVASYGHENGRPIQHGGKTAANSDPRLSTPPAPPRIDVYKPRCDPSANRDDANYCESRKAADAASNAAKWAYVQLWISGAGICFVVVTLIYTKQAAEAAARAALAAEKALLEFERPWLHFSQIKIVRRDQREIKSRKGPIRNSYFITPSVKNVGRMLAIIESVEFRFVPISQAKHEPDYTEMQNLNFPMYVEPGEQTPLDSHEGISAVGPPTAADGGPQEDYVFYGRIRYSGLTTFGHVTGFGITIWGIAPASRIYGNDKYNYHR